MEAVWVRKPQKNQGKSHVFYQGSPYGSGYAAHACTSWEQQHSKHKGRRKDV